MGLARFSEYTRQQVHDYFDPQSAFLAQTGTWGLHAIVRVPHTESDWVFFVTLAQHRGSFAFEESITDAGVLSWQSLPRQTLSDSAVQRWIRHDASRHHIYLFLRVRGPGPYLYMGQLDYVAHDSHRERPVFFKWQIRDWSPPDPIRTLLDLPPAALKTPDGGDEHSSSVHGHAAIALVTRRHVFVQWHSPDGKPQGSPERFRNSLPGLRRLLRLAPGTSLAMMWTDAALLSWGAWDDDHPGVLTYLPWNEKTAALTRAPSSAVNALLPEAVAALLLSRRATDPPPLAASKVDRAVRLGQRWTRLAREVRDVEQSIKALLDQAFPGFRTVCRDWRTKSALWILENYPTPTEFLRADLAVLVNGVSLATASRVGDAKVKRLRAAVCAAVSAADPVATQENLLGAIRLWKLRKSALEKTESMQSALGATGKFPAVRGAARHPRTPLAPDRRPGGRYHVTKTWQFSAQPAPSALECERYSTGWRLLFRAADAKVVRQQNHHLTRVGEAWILESSHPVEVDNVITALPLNEVMIFRLAKQHDQSRAPLVTKLSRRHQHLLLAAEGVAVAGGQPQNLFALGGWRAFLIPETGPVTVTDVAGQPVLQRSALPDYHLKVTGTRAAGIDGSPPVFLGAFPTVEGDASEPLTLIVGQEGRGLHRWRKQVPFSSGRVDLPLPPAYMAMGWFFLRVYDGRQTELETHEFLWIRDLVSIESFSKPSGVAELRFVTAGPLSVSSNHAAVPLRITTANFLEAEIPLHPQFDVTRWSFHGLRPLDNVRNVGIRVTRTAWALGDESAPEQDLVWTTTPIDLPLAAARPTSRQVLYLSVSRTDTLPTQVTVSCANSQKTIPLKSGRGLFPVRNLATAIPLETRDMSPISVTLTVIDDRRQAPRPMALARLVPQYRCGKCGAPFSDNRTGLERHVTEEHPIRYHQPKQYGDYLALAMQAEMVANLPSKVYLCGACSMVVLADKSAYANPTSVMSSHWNMHQKAQPGSIMTFTILTTLTEMESIAHLILPPLGQCLECLGVVSLAADSWSAHVNTHYEVWIASE